MMREKIHICLAFLIILNIFLVISTSLLLNNQNKIPSVDALTIKDVNENCGVEKNLKKVNGDSMEPLIEEGNEIYLLKEFYECNPVKKRDIIAYDFKGNNNPLIKRVLVVGGDKLEFIGNKLNVNNEILKNSNNEIYIFSEQEIKMISFYIEEGKLIEDSYLIFGDNTKSSLDSKTFGAVSSEDFIGKFEIV